MENIYQIHPEIYQVGNDVYIRRRNGDVISMIADSHIGYPPSGEFLWALSRVEASILLLGGDFFDIAIQPNRTMLIENLRDAFMILYDRMLDTEDPLQEVIAIIGNHDPISWWRYVQLQFPFIRFIAERVLIDVDHTEVIHGHQITGSPLDDTWYINLMDTLKRNAPHDTRARILLKFAERVSIYGRPCLAGLILGTWINKLPYLPMGIKERVIAPVNPLRYAAMRSTFLNLVAGHVHKLIDEMHEGTQLFSPGAFGVFPPRLSSFYAVRIEPNGLVRLVNYA